jgi:hypothetical protein
VGDGEKVDTVDRARSLPDRLTGAPAVKAHVTLVIGLALCAVAFWFEFRRALGGNSLSWAYVFEWPLLGGFAVYMWWKVIHPGTDASARKAKEAGPSIAPEFEGMLAAWQTHQEELTRSRETPVPPDAQEQ